MVPLHLVMVRHLYGWQLVIASVDTVSPGHVARTAACASLADHTAPEGLVSMWG